MIWLKGLLFLLFAAVLAFLGMLMYLGHQSAEGMAPGLVDGRLSACPSTPNCVSSESGEDQRHSVAALALSTTEARQSMLLLQNAIAALGGVMVETGEDYMAARFRSLIFGFTDDLELRRDDRAGVWQIRSSSRVGHSDMNVNRERVEELRRLL